jgi:serine/threonine-protein kinase
MHPAAIGPFQIERELGRGGMGEVFLARDTRLDRQVAIKALPAHLTQDPDRLARFQREAKVLASLNHPSIGAIYGLEEARGNQYLILEFVEGETLADRLAKGPIPVDEALPLAKQIAEALEAAHEKGIIHRDLKPGNVMVTDDGIVKVLDFGLARTADGAPSTTSASPNSPTITSPAQFAHSPTIPGVIMGTAGYMSPEQARGKPVDKRSDIFSFGCVLYEMLTGIMPFRGETVADAIGATLHKDSDLNLLPSRTPPRVRELLTSCLEKERKQRLNDIGDARLVLDRAIAGREWVNASAPATSTPRAWLVASATLFLIASAGWVWVALRPAPAATPSPTLELSIPMPKGHEIVGSIAISRDGERVAFTAENEAGESLLVIRSLSRSEFIAVPGSREAVHPAFTPDGRSVLFSSPEGLCRAPVDGGSPTLIVQSPSMMSSCVMDDGSIVYSTGLESPLWRIPAGGGSPVALTNLAAVPGTYAHVWPQPIPGTTKLLFTSWGDGDIGGPRITDTQTGTVREIAKVASPSFIPPARWVASGHVILEQWGTLLAAAYDPETGGTPDAIERNQILTSVAHLGNATRCVFDVSDKGTLAYVPSEPATPRLAWISADGTIKNVLDAKDTTGFEMGGNIAISPDGTQALVGGGGDIAVIDLQRGIPRRITFDAGNNLSPVWSADGSRVLFSSNRQERWAVWSAAASGTAAPELVYKGKNSCDINSVSPDGQLCVVERTADTGNNLWIVDAAGTAKPLVQTRFDEKAGMFSNDGKWVAYESNISGRVEIYVISTTGDAQPVQISFGGGRAPKWGPLGTSLYYRTGRSIARIPMDKGRPAGDAQRVFAGPILERGQSYCLSPDEKQLLAVVVAEESIGREVRIITNFFDRLREVAGPGSRQSLKP